ncbi:MAG: hypothetical protein RSB38_02175 [Oscillospiraceae bacterium]
MAKRTVTLLVAIFVMFSTTATFASVAEKDLFYEVGIYTGVLNFCDSSRNVVVLKNVKPLKNQETSKFTAQEMEYSEIMIGKEGLSLQDGTSLLPVDLNVYVDSDVRVVVARNKSGIKILSLKFI